MILTVSKRKKTHFSKKKTDYIFIYNYEMLFNRRQENA